MERIRQSCTTASVLHISSSHALLHTGVWSGVVAVYVKAGMPDVW